MTSRLASLLVQEGLVAPKQMADAFQRQVIYGGTLDTILLEMNAVPEPTLIAARGRATSRPTAAPMPSVEKLKAAGALTWFPLALAETFHAVPLSVEGSIVRVAVTDPPDRRALDELGLQLGRAIDAVIAPEHRFVHAFAMVYDTQVPARYQSLHARLARRARATSESQPVIEAAPIVAHDEQLTPRLTTRELGAPSVVIREHAEKQPLAEDPARHDDPAPRATEPFHDEALPMKDAVAIIDAATDREEIFAALCRGARSRAEYVALFTVHAETMVGRTALADVWIDRAHLAALSMSLEVPTPFRTASVGHAPLVGKVGEDPTSAALIEALGRKAPRPAVIVPIVLRDRTVALLYADAAGKGLPGATLGELSNGAGAAARAFQRLILAAKGRDYRAAPTDQGAKLTTAAPAVTVDPASGWRSATNEGMGRLASPLEAAPTARHVPSTPTDTEILGLFASVERGDDHARASADRLVALGARGAELAVARMPGPLRIDRNAYRGLTPPLADHGPLLGLIARFGELALPAIERRIGEQSDEIRFYATLALGEIARDRRITRIGANLFDVDLTVRKVSIHHLLRFPESPARTAIIESLRGELPGPNEDRQIMAADALGILGDAQSVPRLIELVKHEDLDVVTAARRALISITAQDFGTSRWRWRGWWERHKGESRTDWLFEGLGHSEDNVRATAADELKRTFTEHYGYHWDAPKRDREDARRRWLDAYRQRRT